MSLIKKKDWGSVIKRMQSHKSDARKAERGDWLPIHELFYYGKGEAPLECVKAIVDAYPDAIRATTNRGKMALHLALYYGDDLLHVDVVKLLLDNFKDAVFIGDKYRQLPLHLASKCNVDIVKILIAANSDACAVKAWNGWLPLHHFVHYDGYDEALMALITAYPKGVFIKDNKGKVPKQLARTDAIRQILCREEKIARGQLEDGEEYSYTEETTKSEDISDGMKSVEHEMNDSSDDEPGAESDDESDDELEDEASHESDDHSSTSDLDKPPRLVKIEDVQSTTPARELRTPTKYSLRARRQVNYSENSFFHSLPQSRRERVEEKVQTENMPSESESESESANNDDQQEQAENCVSNSDVIIQPQDEDQGMAQPEDEDQGMAQPEDEDQGMAQPEDEEQGMTQPQEEQGTSVQITESKKRARDDNINRGTFQAKRPCPESVKSSATAFSKLPGAIAEIEASFGLVPSTNQSFLDRIGTVEELLFGMRQTGFLMTRLNALYNIDHARSVSWKDVIAKLELIVGVESLNDQNLTMRLESLERTMWGDECVEENKKDALLTRLKELVDVCNTTW